MATTTKSTKAKTKTTKAKYNNAKSITKGAKVAKKSTASKASKAAATKKVGSKKSTTTMTMLQKVYAASIAVYAAIAGAAYFLMNDVSYQLSVGYWAKDELASVNGGTQFAPATQGIVDVQVKWGVIALAVLSIVVPLLYLTRLKDYHAKSMKDKVLTARWVDMAIATGIMIQMVAILSGVLDIATLKITAGLMVVTMILGWMAEKRTAVSKKAAVREYYLSMITGLLPWLLILSYAIFTYVYGTLRSPWYVYALYALMLIGASVIGKHQLKALKAEGGLKNYETVEQNYAVLSLITRTAFAAILIVGLLAQ